jgi:hypothetical protein
MKPTVEIARFVDGRLMVLIRFYAHSNFRIHDLESASWVPTLEELAHIKEVVDLTNEHNEIKKRLNFDRRD